MVQQPETFAAYEHKVATTVSAIRSEHPHHLALELLRLLSTMLHNILANPRDPKFRSLKVRNRLVQKIMAAPEAVDLFVLMGFYQRVREFEEVWWLELKEPTVAKEEEAEETAEGGNEEGRKGSGGGLTTLEKVRESLLRPITPMEKVEVASRFVDEALVKAEEKAAHTHEGTKAVIEAERARKGEILKQIEADRIERRARREMKEILAHGRSVG
ncbi:hypothetical protein BJ742DRAFT_778419 [Cladochytrium replicatum]|nr:hypothetical protein BJ742DRAFT_778419 [Cladochytrium replicatum]